MKLNSSFHVRTKLIILTWNMCKHCNFSSTSHSEMIIQTQKSINGRLKLFQMNQLILLAIIQTQLNHLLVRKLYKTGKNTSCSTEKISATRQTKYFRISIAGIRFVAVNARFVLHPKSKMARWISTKTTSISLGYSQLQAEQEAWSTPQLLLSRTIHERASAMLPPFLHHPKTIPLLHQNRERFESSKKSLATESR